jgi:membrane protease YdiL (CAAX protease family)
MKAVLDRNSYFRETGTLLYSYLICLPLLLLYELLIQISQPDAEYLIRISVDAWFKAIFSVLGFNALSITFLIAALAGVFILWRDRHRLKSIRKHYFFIMLAEALMYAILLAILISGIVQSLLMFSAQNTIADLPKLQLLALSLGAGLYEELFFRVILVSILIWVFSKILKKKWMAYASAVILAALCFSYVHYIGEFGDPFTIGSFLFRFLFGLALNLIYVIRGFGMAAWTHAIYDILVIMAI